MHLPRSPLAALLIPLLLALSACSLNALPGQAGAPPTALPSGYPALPEGLPRATVERVVDGDTVVVRVGGREERVRLIGINTPESVDPRRPVECFGAEASANAKLLLDGRTVLLEDDPSQDSRDSNGRMLRYVWLEDGRLANLEQVSQGFAAEYTYSTPYKYRDLFREAQRAARDAGRGLWATDTCDGLFTPLGEAPAPGPAQAGGGAERPATCPRVAQPETAPEAPVRIVGLDKVAETVTLQNVSAGPVNLDGWVICSQRGNESQRGVGGTLAAGETRTFQGDGATIWSNGSRDDAALLDASGRLVSYWEDSR